MTSKDVYSFFVGFRTCLKRCGIYLPFSRHSPIQSIVRSISFLRPRRTIRDIWSKDDRSLRHPRNSIISMQVFRWRQPFKRVSSIEIPSSRSWKAGLKPLSVVVLVSVASVSSERDRSDSILLLFACSDGCDCRGNAHSGIGATSRSR